MNHFFLRANGMYVRVNFHEILYIESRNNYVQVVTTTKSYMVLISLKQLQSELPENKFCRVHRSFIVSLDQVRAFNHEGLYIDDNTIPIGKEFREQFERSLPLVQCEVRSGKDVTRKLLAQIGA